MEEENLFGTMVKYLRVNGKKERKTEMEYGNHQREIIMKGNGKTIDRVEKAVL